MERLEGKVAAIIGASGGLGKEVSCMLAEKGLRLLLCSNDKKSMNELTCQLDCMSADYMARVADATEECEIVNFFKIGKEKYGNIDILINLPGISIPAEITAMDVKDYDMTMDVNLKSIFLCSKHFIQNNTSNSSGQIINIGSMAAKRANANAPLYCAAKAAVNTLSEGMAVQLKSKDIRVTVLNPGAIDTAFWGERKVAREKFMKAHDVAEIILFVLCTDSRIVFHELSFESFENFK